MTTEELATFQSEKMPGFIAAWFDRIKERVGYAESVTAFDQEIMDLAAAAVSDMLTGGVPEALFAIGGTIDTRILNTITLYVNAYIEHDRSDTRKYTDLFHRQVMKLSLEDGGGWDVDESD